MPKKLDARQAAMTEVFHELHRVLKPGGHLAFELGEVHGGKIKLQEAAVPCGVEAGFEPVRGEFVIERPAGSDPAPLPPSSMPHKLLAHEKYDCIAGATAGRTCRSPETWRDAVRSRSESPFETATPDPATLTPASSQSSHQRGPALGFL